jgi:uncharacterized RDD family membrane protein YckC
VAGTASPPPPAPITAIQCPRCSKVNDAGARFCYSCGLPLTDTGPGGRSLAITDFELQLGGRPAGFWIRVVAFLIDLALILTVSSILWEPLFDRPYWTEWFITTDEGVTRSFRHNYEIWDFLFQGAYFTLTMSLWGTTVGMRVLNLWVVDDRGARIKMLRALGRYAASLLSGLILMIGFIMLAFRSDKRALHDLMAGTWVIIGRRKV